MRRKYSDVVSGVRPTGERASATTDDGEEFSQPKFKSHQGTSRDDDELDSKTNESDGPVDKVAQHTSGQVDAFEAGFAAWIVRNFKTIMITIGSIVSIALGAVYYGTSHVTKYQSVLENTQQDVKEIRVDVRRLNEDALRQKLRVDQFEKNQERFDRALPLQRQAR